MGIGLVAGIAAFSLLEAAEEIRATGIVKASRYVTVQTPQMAGPSSRLTLVGLVPNGAVVKEGEVLAQFDSTEQLDAERQAQAKVEDLSHQVEQKRAENEAAAAQRRLDLRQAGAELEEARIQLRKGPLLSDIDRLKNEARAAAAEMHVASLKKSSALHADESRIRQFARRRDCRLTFERRSGPDRKQDLQLGRTIDDVSVGEDVSRWVHDHAAAGASLLSDADRRKAWVHGRRVSGGEDLDHGERSALRKRLKALAHALQD